MNYYGDPHDMNVMIAVMRRALAIIEHLRAAHAIGDVLVEPALAAKARLPRRRLDER